MRIARRALLAVAVVVLAAHSGCSKEDKAPAAGGMCDLGKRACADGKAALLCVNGVWQKDTCKGPKGCYLDKGLATCDLTGNESGDPCPTTMDGFSGCKSDGKTRVICKSGQYSFETCKGKDGCTLTQVGVTTCDYGPPVVDDKCFGDARIQHCDESGKLFVQCKDGKYALSQKCPGPLGCTEPGGGLVSCDANGKFEDGDLCVLLAQTCTDDKAAQLLCENGKFKRHECPGPERCSLGGTRCDTGFATLDTPCAVEGALTCSDDKKSLLECKAKKKAKPTDDDPTPAWTVKKPCKGECTPKDGAVECK
ncbi:MAG: hypothetical protein ABI175_21755 [Polyangiales bacterium]